MSYDASTDSGFPCRPAAAAPVYVQLPFDNGGGTEGSGPRLYYGTMDPNTAAVAGRPGDLFVLHDMAASPTYADLTDEKGIWLCVASSLWAPLDIGMQMVDGWGRDNLPASQASVYLPRYSYAANGAARLDAIMAPWDGYLLGAMILPNPSTITGGNGTLTVHPFVGGIEVEGATWQPTLTADDAAANINKINSYKTAKDKVQAQFSRGTILEMKYTTTADWDYTTADVRAGLLIARR